jgi:hypothetical protein
MFLSWLSSSSRESKSTNRTVLPTPDITTSYRTKLEAEIRLHQRFQIRIRKERGTHQYSIWDVEIDGWYAINYNEEQPIIPSYPCIGIAERAKTMIIYIIIFGMFPES